MFDGLGEITSLKLAEAAEGKPTTFAFVNLASHEEAKKAVERIEWFQSW